MTIKLIAGAVFGATLLAATASVAQSAADKRFITKAMEGNLGEVQMGQLADQNGGSQEVKAFGMQLVQDHGADNQKAEQLANQLGVSTPGQTDREHLAAYRKLSKLQGAAFDKAFVRKMVEDHRKDVRDYRAQAKKQGDPTAAYAADSLPVLEKHLRMAEQLERSHMSQR